MVDIVMNNLTKTYRQGEQEVHAIAQIDLTIRSGEFTALMGPSGSGKSTLLHLIGGLDVPSHGNIRVGDLDMGTLTKRQRSDMRLHQVGFVFQSFNLLPVLTAFENAELVLLLQGVAPKHRRERVLDLLSQVGLAGLENRRPHEMSGGQQQRVAIVRAIAGDPLFVLADEPTANLDSDAGNALIELMESLNQSRGTTFLFATHDPKVMHHARRVIRLVDGNIESDQGPIKQP